MGERKYFLDWLRVIAFALLILFHVGMLYVPWYYNIKSERIFDQLQYAMIALNPWRLALLFFISGVACRFLLAKLNPGGFAKDRVRRLVPVILLGMLVINPAQVYVEFLHKDIISGGYMQFWLGSYLLAEPYPNRIVPTWDHLWFLVYLLFYALGLALLARFKDLTPKPEAKLAALLVVPALWLCFTNALVSELKPTTHAFFDDWATHLRWVGVFAAGVVCAGSEVFWQTLRAHRRRLAVLSAALLALHWGNFAYERSGQADPFWDGIAYACLKGVYGWSVILCLAGYAAEYLNKPSAALTYLTEAVLPVYVLHQPVLLVTAYVLLPLALPLFAEVALLILATGVGSFLGYEVFARRGRLLRFAFGLKPA